MNEIPPIAGCTSTASSAASDHLARPGSANRLREEEIDRADISEAGQRLSSLAHDDEIRADKVARIRQAIADGTYLTEEKIAITVDRLFEALETQAAAAI